MVNKATKEQAPKKKAAKKQQVTVKTAPVKDKASPEKKKTKTETPPGPGKKYTCVSCGTKFYDLHKPEKICPKCGADQLSAKPVKTKMPKSTEYDVEEEDEVQDVYKPDEGDFAIEDEEEI